MGSSPPALQSPGTTANVQAGLNTTAAEQTQAGSAVNQNNPFGSINQTQTGVDQYGNPTYTTNTTLSPAEQELLGLQQAGGMEAGAGAAGLLSGANYGATNPTADIGNLTSGLMGQTEQQFQGYEQPFFNQQTEALQSQLANQGLTPGNPAYDTAINNLRQSQGQTTSGFLSQMEPQAFSQAQSLYQEPASMATSLASLPGAQPQLPTEQTVPGLNVAAPNYEGDVSAYNTAEMQAYQAQQALMGNVFSGLGQLGGGLAKLAIPSDRRLKRDIQRVGTMFDGTAVYRYRMGGRWHLGLMADEVQKYAPEAVASITPAGYLGVDYKRATDRAARYAHG